MKREYIENTYWNNNGKYQKLADKLQKLIPYSGEVKNPKVNYKLEKFRKLVNAYHDLYNNGGANNERTRVALYFPRAMSLAKKNDFDSCYEITEPIIDKAILDAGVEQGFI